MLNVKQPAVSKVLAKLDTRVPGRRDDPRLLVVHYLSDYPGPGGTATYWRTSIDPSNTALLLSQVGYVISGDCAAEADSAWRTPTSVLAYTDRPVDLIDEEVSNLGLVDVDADVANVAIVSRPLDTVLLTGGVQWGDDAVVSTVDPLHVAWDLARQDTGGDRLEAADFLLFKCIDGWRVGGEHSAALARKPTTVEGACGHCWQPSPRRRKDAGCPICAIAAAHKLRSQPLPGRDLATARPDLAAEFAGIEGEPGLTPSDLRPHSNKRAEWTCNSCRQNWVTSVANRMNGSRCPHCASTRARPVGRGR